MKKTKNKSDDLVAFNTRVHRPIKETVKESSKLAGVNMEDIAHDAWRFYFGINDEMLDHRRKLVIAAAKKVTGGKLPFNAPWPPTKSNAIAPAPRNGIVGGGHHKNGAVAQLAERVNGIHKVTGSTPVSSTTPTKNKGKIVVIPLGPKEQSLAE